MGVTHEKSTQFGNRDSNPPVANEVQDVGGKLRLYRFDYTQSADAGDATSTQSLCKIKAGKGYIIPILSRFTWALFGASRTLDIGHGGWTEPDGDVVNAAADVLTDGVDVSSAGVAFMGAGTNGNKDAIAYNSVGEIDIKSVVAGGTIPAGTTIKGWIAVVEQA